MKKKLIGISIIGIILGLVATLTFVIVFQKEDVSSIEVSYVSPSEAVIFWKTNQPSIGYAMIGDSQFSQPRKIEQTSSSPGEVHVVVVDAIKKDGMYFTLHTNGESALRLPKVHFSAYVPPEEES